MAPAKTELKLKPDPVFKRRLEKLSTRMGVEVRAEEKKPKAEAQTDLISALRSQQARNFNFWGLKIRQALS